MTKHIQFRRYANTALNSITAQDGELIIDKTNKTLKWLYVITNTFLFKLITNGKIIHRLYPIFEAQ